MIYSNKDDTQILMNTIKALAKLKGLKYKDLAERAGLTKSNVATTLTRRTSAPTLDTLKRLASAVDCDIDVTFIDKATGQRF